MDTGKKWQTSQAFKYCMHIFSKKKNDQLSHIEVKNAVYWLTVRDYVGDWCICKTDQL